MAGSTTKDQDLLISFVDALDAVEDVPQGVDHSQIFRGVHADQWSGFCRRIQEKKVKPTCAIDFQYLDKRGLNLSKEDALLMRMYCYKDLTWHDDPSTPLPACIPSGAHECRLVLHVHTLKRWGDRHRMSLKERVDEASIPQHAFFLFAAIAYIHGTCLRHVLA